MLPELTLSLQFSSVAKPEPHRAALPRHKVTRWLRAALQDDAELTVRIVDASEGQALNRDYRQKDYATNVLTFEYGVDADGVIMGDIVLCVPILQREAREQHKTLLDHAAHLVVHGTLHALGYDHIETAEAQEMETLETRILKKMGIADPYQT